VHTSDQACVYSWGAGCKRWTSRLRAARRTSFGMRVPARQAFVFLKPYCLSLPHVWLYGPDLHGTAAGIVILGV